MICSIRSFVPAGAILAAMTMAGCTTSHRVAVDPRKACIDATSTMRQAADDPDWVTRAVAIEALSQTMGAKAGPVFKEALRDKVPAVRFAAAMAIGDVRYTPAKPLLVDMAKKKDDSPHAEPDKRVFCAVIYALHRMGDTRFTHELASLLFDQERDVRANAAMVMGKLGEPSARVPLKTRLEDELDPSVQLQFVEALAMLGDTQQAFTLESYTKNEFLEDRLDAISAMARLRPPRAVLVLRKMLDSRQPPPVRIAAAGALGRLGHADDRMYRLCVRALEKPKEMLRRQKGAPDEIPGVEVRSLQRLAAIALGWMNRQDAADVLHPLLRNSNGGVRVAAAMSLVRLLEAYRPVVEPAEPQPKPKVEPASQPAARTRPVPKLYTAGGKD